jgi:hypothetical protein
VSTKLLLSASAGINVPIHQTRGTLLARPRKRGEEVQNHYNARRP